MSPELLVSLGKIVGSIVLLAGVLATVSWLRRPLKLQPEVARKLIHVSLGLYSLLLPAIFTRFWEAAVTCGLALVLFAAVRAGPARAAMGEGLHGVKRTSYGELLFAASVLLLFHFKDGHAHLRDSGLQSRPELLLYVLPLLILTLCDAACAVVGVNYGRNTFRVEAGIKSWEGVGVFVVTAWLVSLIAILLVSDVDRADAVALAFIVAGFGALLEAASWRGLDNLFIPLGLYFLLSNLLPRGLPVLVGACAGFVLVIAALLAVGRRLGADRHVIASGATLLFCIGMFSGPLSLLAPLTAALAYGVVWRTGARTDTRYDALSLILAMLVIALVYYVLSDVLKRDVIFSFDVTFCALAAAILARFLPNRPGALAAGGGALACLALAPRLLLSHDPQAFRWIFAGLALALVLAAAAVAWMARRAPAAPWLKLSGLGLAAGLALLPLSPA